jgi:hypothetical protein
MGTRAVLAVGVGAAVAGGAELVSTGAGVDVEVGDAVLPHPAATIAASVSAAIFRGVTTR